MVKLYAVQKKKKKKWEADYDSVSWTLYCQIQT